MAERSRKRERDIKNAYKVSRRWNLKSDSREFHGFSPKVGHEEKFTISHG